MGARGPVPKRSTERRRHKDKPTKGTVGAPIGGAKPPKIDEDWHPAAQQWYRSLQESGQSEFYEASDWAMAYIVAESISRDLNEQVVAVPERTGEPVYAKVPMKGASLAAYLKAMSSLMVTEGDRRRAGIELEKAASGGDDKPAGVTALDEYRKRLAG